LGSKTFAENQARDIVGEIEALVVNEKFNFILKEKMDVFFREAGTSAGGIKDVIYEAVEEYYLYMESVLGKEKVRITEKTVTLKVLDLLWVKHLEEVTQIQEASLVLSISQGGFFEEYEMRLSKAYQQMLLSIPRIITMTFFRTINKLLMNK
jgi:preprotein translocase subunit SecA